MKFILRKQNLTSRHSRHSQKRRRRFWEIVPSFLLVVCVIAALIFNGLESERALGVMEPSVNVQSPLYAEGGQIASQDQLNKLLQDQLDAWKKVIQDELFSDRERQELGEKVLDTIECIKLVSHRLSAQIDDVAQIDRVAQIYSRIYIFQKSTEIIQTLTLISKKTSEEVVLTSFWIEFGKILEQSVDWFRNHTDEQIAKTWAIGYLGYFYEVQHSLPGRIPQDADLDNARKLTEEALKIAEATMQRAISYRWEWQLGRIYNSELERDPSSKEYLEKAIDFYALAYKDIQVLRREILPASRENQFTFRDRVEPLYREYVSLLLKQPDWQQKQIDDRNVRQIISSLQLAELENFLECNLQFESRDYGNIDNVIEQDRTVALIYPIILKDRLEVLLKLPGQPTLERRTQYIEKQVVENTLSELRLNLEKPYFSSSYGVPAAKKVYDWLIRPFEEAQPQLLDQNNIKTLVFVLDGALRNVPMAALCAEVESDRCKTYLIEKYAIALSPTLQIPEDAPRPPRKAFIAGLVEQPEDSNFGRLEYVTEEINSVKSSFSDPTVLQKLSKDALKRADLASYDVVHLATHSEFGGDLENTFILTADARIKLTTFPDLFRSRSDDLINLLVLSSCETATGNNREVLGIAGASIQAGARSVLATLWSIDDSATSVLMKDFYEGYVGDKSSHEGLTKVKALQRAQIDLLKQPLLYKPSYWAAYVLVGDWR